MLHPIVIAAGGTGGHMVPAESVADELMRRGQRIVLMTDARSAALRSPVFDGCERHVLAGAGLAGRSLGRRLSGVAQLARGTGTARRLLAQLDAAAVVGFGGYPSVPPILAAATLRRRPAIVLHDQNAVLGGANRFLARFADHIALSFEGTAGLPATARTTITGNPVRAAISALAASPYPPPAETIRLLVLGGSLGARVFATLVPAALALLPEALRRRIVLTMQCPAEAIGDARGALDAAGIKHELAPFFSDVAPRMAGAHLLIARSGGSTVAEVATIGRPAIFIPLAINTDQRHNADVLARRGGALRLDQATTTPELLARALGTLLDDPARLAAMAEASAGARIEGAAMRLADLVLSAIAERVR
ncbi:MAG TPA: UDP-N-acetylglucosamine--N-acetylmuramyl-(pentapeptide) pyrophosphoryl-undecaprenol N-acetylglucosamine transferase [Acidiphilium sp.]|nr:UDP-N-acetylglucosamine--N-acetylmuramyl-(pentapeptide) pyrophosphoryl-undecaprenol N-acetylglucosamine transferase [Acidiphilium sp.]